ncbi:MAG: type II toxin-antitoxin system HicA family toxin [Alphaproteobacteria bacterium]|nr:type II toxin-antitoxin system HicA family toxin [Alphaproteobacteria bacterium]
MPKRYTAKEIMKMLKKDGWYLVRITGSHYVYHNDVKKSTVSVPLHKIMPIGTALSILKQAGLK